MTKLDPRYADLAAQSGPLMLVEALRLYGTLEKPGSANNPVILKWADEVGAGHATAYNRWAANWYDADSIPWCGLFMAVVALRSSQGRAERMPPDKYLAAASWANWGRAVTKDGACLGDVLVFTRTGGAHVGIYVGEDASYFHVLGGNQSDSVNITRIAKSRLTAVRRPPYLQTPSNVRKIMRAATGQISRNEA